MTELLTGIILAGGNSTRFGSDKASALLNGRPMLGWVATAVAAVCDPVIVVRAHGQRLPASGVPVTVVEDFVADQGPLAGLVTGLRIAPGLLAFATSCDAPLLRPKVIELLARLAGDYDVVYPEVDGHPQPLVAVYRVARCLPVLEAALAGGATRLFEACATLNLHRVAADAIRAADPQLDSFRNANRRQELVAVERRLAAGN